MFSVRSAIKSLAKAFGPALPGSDHYLAQMQVLRAWDAELANSMQPLCTSLAEVYFSGRYPGFDLEDPDWPDFRAKLEQVRRVLETVRERVGQT